MENPPNVKYVLMSQSCISLFISTALHKGIDEQTIQTLLADHLVDTVMFLGDTMDKHIDKLLGKEIPPQQDTPALDIKKILIGATDVYKYFQPQYGDRSAAKQALLFVLEQCGYVDIISSPLADADIETVLEKLVETLKQGDDP